MPRRTDAPPPRTADTESAVLRGFLDYLRDAIARKVEGAPEPQVREPAVPSGTSLLGLLTHVTAVEGATFLGEKVASWPKTFRPSRDDTVADVVARYRATVARANEVLDERPDLAERLPGGPSLRWAIAHMIEETGRHTGHADIIRELIDGSTGR